MLPNRIAYRCLSAHVLLFPHGLLLVNAEILEERQRVHRRGSCGRDRDGRAQTCAFNGAVVNVSTRSVIESERWAVNDRHRTPWTRPETLRASREAWSVLDMRRRASRLIHRCWPCKTATTLTLDSLRRSPRSHPPGVTLPAESARITVCPLLYIRTFATPPDPQLRVIRLPANGAIDSGASPVELPSEDADDHLLQCSRAPSSHLVSAEVRW